MNANKLEAAVNDALHYALLGAIDWDRYRVSMAWDTVTGIRMVAVLILPDDSETLEDIRRCEDMIGFLHVLDLYAT